MSIVLDHVSFACAPDRPVLSDLSLAARSGEVVALLGATGAGKTTVFRLLAGLARADKGDVRVAGVSVAEEPREARRRAAYVPDEPLTYPTLSALENVDLFGRLGGVDPEEARGRGETLLRAAGLWEARHRWVASYSPDMRQKLAMAVALLHRPQVLIMDEPFAGLDAGTALSARVLLRDHAAGGGTVLFSTHGADVAEVLADRVAVLHRGRIAYDEPRRTVERDGGALAVLLAIGGGHFRPPRSRRMSRGRSCPPN